MKSPQKSLSLGDFFFVYPLIAWNTPDERVCKKVKIIYEVFTFIYDCRNHDGDHGDC